MLSFYSPSFKISEKPINLMLKDSAFDFYSSDILISLSLSKKTIDSNEGAYPFIF